MSIEQVLSYAAYLFSAIFLVLIFLKIYCRFTPIDEFLLIRQGNVAATLSLSGAILGFVLTIVSSILHANNFIAFFTWATGALAIQLFAYTMTHHILKMSKEQIQSGNVAFGGLVGAISLSLGAINAACVS